MIRKTNKRVTGFERDVSACLILDVLQVGESGAICCVGGAASVGRSGQVGLVIFKCFLESNKPAEIVVECDFSAGLGRL